MSAELSPQSDDVAKSLIQFADGKPLGEFGGYWLAVHIANLFGIDKVSFDERVRWVQDFQKEILDSADNPLDGFRFWTTADDPWCALAACFEWSRFVSFGAEAMSYLPIAMDGSCSGIQHFSAMLRDAEGGKAVNLTPSETPTDIYTEVLNVVKAKLMADSEPLAKVWMDKVDRKIVKRPCMTFAYSVTSIGIREQISGEMRKQSDGQYIPGWENWQAAAFLAPVVEDSIREVVKRAAEAMDWLKEVSKAYSKEQIPTSWVTPLGFPVVQPYRKAKGKQFWVWFQGSKIRLTLRVESRDVDSRKQASSVAPNYVHSLDATHLMMVVNMMKNEGITDSFAMIHDSFGVHAADVDELHYAIRDQFIELYSDDVLTQVYQQCLPALPGKRWKDVPVPPEKGTLDLQEVRDADFFFA
jgi:DNA-directed RNA polymerase